MLKNIFDKLQLEQKLKDWQIFHDIFLRPPLTINSLVGLPWWFIISSSHPAQAFLSPQMRMAPLSKFHAIFTITRFSSFSSRAMATISVQILSEGNEKALINPRMVINDKLRKHFQIQMQVSLPNISDLVKNFELKGIFWQYVYLEYYWLIDIILCISIGWKFSAGRSNLFYITMHCCSNCRNNRGALFYGTGN